MSELVRINARLGKKHNDFLERESKETGISKSALIQLAVDQYMTQRVGIVTMQQMLEKMDNMEKQIQK